MVGIWPRVRTARTAPVAEMSYSLVVSASPARVSLATSILFASKKAIAQCVGDRDAAPARMAYLVTVEGVGRASVITIGHACRFVHRDSLVKLVSRWRPEPPSGAMVLVYE